jgi:hypothetical protein
MGKGINRFIGFNNIQQGSLGEGPAQKLDPHGEPPLDAHRKGQGGKPRKVGAAGVEVRRLLSKGG